MAEMQVQAMQNFDNAPVTVNEFTLHSDPDRFVFDFKAVVPQFSPGGSEPTLIVAHKTVVMEPFLAKQLLEFLQRQLKEYEKGFGEIKRSAASLKAEKLAKSKAATASVEKPHYMG